MELKVPVEELRKKKLFLACPMYGGQCAGMFARSVSDLSALCTHYGIQLQMYFLFNESLITRARNYCCDEFLRSEASHLMFIDSDIGFNPHDVIALLALSKDEDNDYDVIGGPYPKKCISWEKIKMAVDKGYADEDPNTLEKFVGDYVFNPAENQTQIKINEPVKVREIGTGFMMLRKTTLERYRDRYPFLSYRPDHIRTEHFDGSREIHAFFDCHIDRGYDLGDLQNVIKNAKSLDELKEQAQKLWDAEAKSSKRYLSEDYMFSYNVQKMGGSVWFCPWMKLQHVGSYVFGGSLADLATIGAPATADAKMLGKNKAEKLKGKNAAPRLTNKNARKKR